ncbi:multidrug effflux MFS transporter [Microbacterium betulae]|uniref:Multidrug effflux MFS transporter n=1 Tax=Microbacterium betulae TaxID=2981139 RepID=A0AA97FJU4_9MICO|nr:multidrug effflux MFS transporter [Microbacterium sp. AB]WOF22837.1 multidrug effflux MFS transporter [Microbacterium sp. AB]
MTPRTQSDQHSTTTATARIGIGLMLTLALLSGIAPFAIDMYLPAFPEMVAELDTTASGVQLSLTAFLVGAGVGQVIFGPLSDRFGRLGPLVAGMLIYLAASVATALAPTVEFLIGARLVQGLAGAAGMVISRAIISDLAKGVEAARGLSVVMTVSGIAPVLAPVAGSLLTEPIGWRGLMWVVTGLVAIGLIAVFLSVRETRPRTVRDAARQGPKTSPVRALTSRAYLGNMLAYVFAFTTMMAYISASPFLYQGMMGMDQVQYGLAFGLNALALMLVGALSARLTRRFHVAALARTGLLLNLASVAVFAVLVFTGAPAIWLTVPILVSVGVLGLSFGNATALALAAVPAAAGLGSAILGLLQHVFAGIAAPIVSIAGETTAVPLAITMLVTSALANIAFAVARGADPRHSAAPATEPATERVETA